MENVAIAIRRQYQREWRRRNSERIKIYNSNYWKRKAEKIQQEQRKQEGEKK